MKRKTFLLAALAFVSTMLVPASAQTEPKTEVPFNFEKVLPGTRKPGGELKKTNAFPMFNQMMLNHAKTSLMREPVNGASLYAPLKAGEVLTVLPNLEIWADILSNNFTGICMFNPVSDISFTRLASYEKGYFNAGSGLVEDAEQLHGIYLDTTYSGWGIILIIHFAFDTQTWEMIGEPQVVRDYSVVATETANDPQTGEVFGEFYSSDLSRKEFGVIDYQTMTRTTIGPATHQYVAMGITSDGKAYGVANDGNLYHIDRNTGEETLKGSTGIQVARHDGNAYFQSGEIDPRTDEFYWASVDSTGLSMLYTVDLNDGHVTQVGSLLNANVMGLTIPAPKAANAAPAAIENLTKEFTGSSLSGKIKFRAPDKTFGGSALSGALTYNITSNKNEIATGTVQAGSECEVDVTLPEGINRIAVTVSNGVGRSPKTKMETYIGFDIPKAATNVKLEINSANKATVTWDAPTEGVYGGFLGTLKYDIYKISGSDTTLIVNDYTGTTYTGIIPSETLKKYIYAVRAKNEKHQSSLAFSNGVEVGSAFSIPFFDDFLTETDAALYTIIDANNDGSTWKWLSGSTNCFFYKFSDANRGDDWLITPPIHLHGGKNYTLSFRARNSLKSCIERIEVMYGQGNKASDMANQIMGPTELSSISYTPLSSTFSPSVDGDYHFGFHAISDAEMYFLYMDSLMIESAEPTRPAAVTDLTISPDPSGTLKALFSFKTPTQTTGGTTLSTISRIEIRKDNYIIKTINNPTPGANITATDDKATKGRNEYSVIAFNGEEPGERATGKVFIGIDKPTVPVVRVIDQTTSAKITWQPVEGATGGIIIPSEVRYDIYNVTDAGAVGEKIGSVKGGTEYIVSGLSNNDGPQNYKQWAVNANTDMGSSLYGVGAIVVGAPYILPFHNSFKELSLENQFFAIERPNKETTWEIIGDMTVDNDGGAIVFRPQRAGTASIVSGKISLNGATLPKLLFDYRALSGTKGALELEIVKKDGTSSKIWESNFAALPAGETKWNHVILDLPSDLIGQDYIRVRIRGIANASLESTPIYFDNINITDPLQKDAAISMTTVESVKKGQPINLNIRVTNVGIDNIRGSKVIVTANGKEAFTTTINQDVQLMQQVEIPVTVRTSSLDQSSNMKIVARVETENDLEDANNSQEEDVKLNTANLPQPTNLRAEQAAGNKLKLTWKEPNIETNIVNDDFETYEAWATSFGDWTTVDADHGHAGALSEKGTYPHQDEQFAFLNWQPSDIFGAGQGLDPHSGKHALVSIYQFTKDGTKYVDANNWLISPLLSGREQTIRFWVNNFKPKTGGRETFDVLVSSTDIDTASFVKIGDTRVQESGKWTEISVKLPAGTRYFAIHHNTSKDQASIFMIDDASYETGNILTSYNIYCDGAYRGNTSETNYSDIPFAPDMIHDYSVTAVYFDGSESAPITIHFTTDIETIERDKPAAHDIYTLGGALVRRKSESLHNLQPGIYIVDGRKCIVK